MPFCRECGKQVEDDWVTCPFCSQPIGPPDSAILGVQDSVVMGDINISKSGEEPTSCSNCGAAGSVKLACSKCRNHCTCVVCVDDFSNELVQEFIKSGRYELHDYILQSVKLQCRSCFEKYVKTICRSVCDNCKCKYSRKQSFSEEKGLCFECSFIKKIGPLMGQKSFEKRKDLHAPYHSKYGENQS